MLPVKIKKFNGLYTNYDPNDMSLEVFVESNNFKHTKGKLLPIPELMTEDSLPNVDLFHNEVAGTWALEKYIITDITNDPIPRDAISATYRIHFAVFKRSYTDSGKTYYVRSCWFREQVSSTWFELSVDGNYSTNIFIQTFNPLESSPVLRYGSKFLTTDKDGTVFFYEQDGVLKIYMPHDAFWFGRIKRTNKFRLSPNSMDQYYFDRILEPYQGGNSLVGGTLTSPSVSFPCRSAVNFPLAVTTTGTIYADEITLTYPQGVDYSLVLLISGVFPPRDVLTHSWNPVRDSKGNTIPFKTLVNGLADLFPSQADSGIHFAFKLSSTACAFWKEYFDFLSVKIRATGEPFDLASRLAPIITIEYDGDPLAYQSPTGNGFYVFDISEITDAVLQFDYIGTQLISDIGFDPIYTKAFLIFTAQYDNREEIVLTKKEVGITNNGDRWAFVFGIPQVPLNNNARITRYFIYLKFNKEDQYEQYKEIIVEKMLITEVMVKYLSPLDATGKYLNQTIGFTFTEDNDDYGVQNQFSDVITLNGFGYALYKNDILDVYHSAYGRGKIMPDLFYPDNRIDVKGVAFVKKLIPVGNYLGLVTNVKMVLIQTQAVDGTLIFDTFDTMPYGIENREDAISVQGGAILKTEEGIFYTNGYEIKDKISEPIDNLVRAGTGTIHYNPIRHELYWIYSTTPVKFIRYRFEEKVWETLHKTQSSGLVDLVIGPEGSVNYITAGSVFLEDPASLLFSGYLKTGQTDLGHPEIDKYLDEIYIDSKGYFGIAVWGDDTLIYSFLTEDPINRNTLKLFYPLENRVPFTKIHIEIQSGDPTAELYDVLLMIDVIPRRKDG